VEVEVVLGEVREDAACEADPRNSAQLESVRRHLHRGRHVAPVNHPPEGVLEVDRLRRRALDLLLHASHHALHGSEQPGLAAGGLEQVADEEGRGGLAVRPCDAHHVQLGRRVVIKARGGGPHRGADVVHHHVRHAQLERALRDERRGPPLHRIRSEIMAVRAEARHAKKERPRGDALA
jgi:hypothetical protein